LRKKNLRVTPISRFFFLNYHHHRAHHQNPHVPWLYLGRFVERDAPRPLFWQIYFAMWRGPRPLP
jgi:fatty acid desaturase